MLCFWHFSFLLNQGIYIHLSSQENKIQNENQQITIKEISEYVNDDTDEYMAYFDVCENKLRQILPQKVKINK